MTDQDHAARIAAAELARRIRAAVPASCIADPEGWARRYWDDAREHGWRWIDRTAAIRPAGTGTPPDRHAGELEAARASCAAASTSRTRKDT